jgi:hypothetical protein
MGSVRKEELLTTGFLRLGFDARLRPHPWPGGFSAPVPGEQTPDHRAARNAFHTPNLGEQGRILTRHQDPHIDQAALFEVALIVRFPPLLENTPRRKRTRTPKLAQGIPSARALNHGPEPTTLARSCTRTRSRQVALVPAASRQRQE